jgi:hypothetical protein
MKIKFIVSMLKDQEEDGRITKQDIVELLIRMVMRK